MKGNEIMVSAQPRGQRVEGIISGTPKPGTCMQIKSSVEPVGGRHTWEIYAPSTGQGTATGDGVPQLVAVLDIDPDQGKIYSDAYVTGTRGFLWLPLAGDEINVRKADISGTSSATEDLNIGEKCMVINGTGLISPIAVGVVASPVSYPFQSMETITDQPAEMLVWCVTTGY